MYSKFRVINDSNSETFTHFTAPLIQWYRANKRDLPWRNTHDPYKIWVSEIMLQQTRVDQAKPYYEKFLKHFSDVQSLADAPRQDLLKIWEGLGYYSRARNMQDAAKQIMADFDGKFPDNYDDLLSLKGVGPYTAAAISSIAYGIPKAVVDGNVIRVLSRWNGIEDDVRKTGTQKQIQEIADNCIDTENPSDFNQGMMELGAVICLPKNPLCWECPVANGCAAFQMVRTDSIPYKSKKKKTPHHQIAVGICVNAAGEVLIALRQEDKMLGGFWEFPGGKIEKGESAEEAVIRELREELAVVTEVHPKKLIEIKHAYSHFKITMHAYFCRIKDGIPKPKESREIKWVNVDELQDYPFPKANRKLTEAIQELDTLPF